MEILKIFTKKGITYYLRIGKFAANYKRNEYFRYLYKSEEYQIIYTAYLGLATTKKRKQNQET
jgi:hypothetical protein